MKALNKVLAAAAIAGSAIFGGAAIAQEAPALTPDQQFAVDLEKVFQACVGAIDTPAYEQAVADFQAADEAYMTQARQIATDNGDMARLEAAGAAYDATTVGSPEETQAAEAYKAIEAEAWAKIEAQLGAAPVAPVNPSQACEDSFAKSISDAGKDYFAVVLTLQDLAQQLGDEAYLKLTTPEAAPAPQP